MIAHVVRRKCLPRIIGLEVLFPMSMIRKFTGTKVICNSTIRKDWRKWGKKGDLCAMITTMSSIQVNEEDIH
jgi:hypothetical protein